MHFRDTKYSGCLLVKFFVDKTGTLRRTEFSGSLESFCVGFLKDALENMKKENTLNSEAARKVLIKATLHDDTFEGQLSLSDKKHVDFKQPLPTPK